MPNFYDEAWFHHAVTDTVHQLAQQKPSKMYSAVRVKEGVVGKTYPFNRIGTVAMQPITQRHMVGVGSDIVMDKRRVALKDFYVRVYCDELDEVKMLPNLQSEKSMQLAYSRNRQLDDLIAAAALGNATNVDEANEATSTTALPTTGGPLNIGQLIVDGGTGLTLTKIMDSKQVFDENNIPEEERYMFYPPRGMRRLLEETRVTNKDYSSIAALAQGGFKDEEQWYGYFWRMSTRLPKTGNIRSCIAIHKPSMGLAVAVSGKTTVKDRPDLVETTQVELTLSANAIRIEDVGVMEIRIDETA